MPKFGRRKVKKNKNGCPQILTEWQEPDYKPFEPTEVRDIDFKRRYAAHYLKAGQLGNEPMPAQLFKRDLWEGLNGASRTPFLNPGAKYRDGLPKQSIEKFEITLSKRSGFIPASQLEANNLRLIMQDQPQHTTEKELEEMEGGREEQEEEEEEEDPEVIGVLEDTVTDIVKKVVKNEEAEREIEKEAPKYSTPAPSISSSDVLAPVASNPSAKDPVSLKFAKEGQQMASLDSPSPESFVLTPEDPKLAPEHQEALSPESLAPESPVTAPEGPGTRETGPEDNEITSPDNQAPESRPLAPEDPGAPKVAPKDQEMDSLDSHAQNAPKTLAPDSSPAMEPSQAPESEKLCPSLTVALTQAPEPSQKAPAPRESINPEEQGKMSQKKRKAMDTIENDTKRIKIQEDRAPGQDQDVPKDLEASDGSSQVTEPAQATNASPPTPEAPVDPGDKTKEEMKDEIAWLRAELEFQREQWKRKEQEMEDEIEWLRAELKFERDLAKEKEEEEAGRNEVVQL